jgi:hypothetical protein
MKTELEQVNALLPKVLGTKYLPTEAWLEDYLAATPADISLFDAQRLKQLRRAFPELNYNDLLLMKLWSLYEDMLHSNVLEPARDALMFVHFLLAIPKYARRGKALPYGLHMSDEGERIQDRVLAAS